MGRFALSTHLAVRPWRQSLAAYPFVKVEKQLERVHEDSMLSFFTLIPIVFLSRGGRP